MPSVFEEQVLQEIQATLSQSGFDSNRHRLAVGYSGGLDSTLLLSIVSGLYPKLTRAVHVNHQLDAKSNAWEAQCEANCERLGVEFLSIRVDVPNHSGKGLEGAAREARYDAFASALREREWLLLAHHADDQAETVLYRILRGTGVSGLAGIPQIRLLGGATVIRPLLNFWRADLVKIANEQKLAWIEDPSNQDTALDRNYLRHSVIPRLTDRWPNAKKQIQALSALADDQSRWIDDLVVSALKECDFRQEPFGCSLDSDCLLKNEKIIFNSILRYILRNHFNFVPTRIQLDQLRDLCLESEGVSKQLAEFSQVSVHRYRDRLYFLVARPEPPNVKFPWDMSESILIGDFVRLAPKSNKRYPTTIVFRSGGERLKPVARRHSQTLKKLLQEESIEPWLRDITPILVTNGEIQAFGDKIICSNQLPEFRLEWISPHGDLGTNGFN